MSKLTKDDVLKLASLSRLRLSKEEVKKFQIELSEILDYVEHLDNADTKGLEPTYQVTGLKNISREDEVKDYGYKTEDLLLNAPAIDIATKQFKVKRVL
jgi:aspartyl-tRNA(Asn)/glutamyl-tRNA(Gln) amidotransferase subunit C